MLKIYEIMMLGLCTTEENLRTSEPVGFLKANGYPVFQKSFFLVYSVHAQVAIWLAPGWQYNTFFFVFGTN